MAELYITDFSRKYYEDYDRDLEIKRPLTTREVERGIILPAREIPCDEDYAYLGGVLDEEHNFVPESATGARQVKHLKGGYALEKPPVYRDEIVIYGGILYEFYGHVLLESSSRLWCYFKQNPNKYRVVFDVVPGARGKFREFFELWDIPYNDDTFITEPTQYKCVIVPEEATTYETSWHADWLAAFDYMASKVEAEKYEKIYFTRTKLVERNPVLGEKPIETLFRRNGFAVFAPERLSLRRQIALMKGCRVLATVSSSTYHNLLFARNGATLICLNRAFEPDFCQNVVDQARQLKSFYIDASLNPLPVHHVHGPWLIGKTEELKRAFAALGLRWHGKTNTVEAKHCTGFLKEWYGRNARRSLNGEEVLLCQSRIRVVSSHSIYKFIFKLLSALSFGGWRRSLKAESKLH